MKLLREIAGALRRIEQIAVRLENTAAKRIVIHLIDSNR
jgi:hypothetical protein